MAVWSAAAMPARRLGGIYSEASSGIATAAREVGFLRNIEISLFQAGEEVKICEITVAYKNPERIVQLTL